jgi:hypothetical protein
MVYTTEKELDQTAFYVFQIIPKLEETFSLCRNSTNIDSIQQYAGLLQQELKKVASVPDVFQFEYLNNLPEIKNNEAIMQETSDYLTYLSMHFYEKYQSLVKQQSSMMKRLGDSIGIEKLDLMKKDYHNDALENIVTNSNANKEYSIIDNEIIRVKGPIFQEPTSNWGRARLFSPMKMLNNEQTNTFWFNISIIWLFTAICYVFVLFDITGLIRKTLRIV